MLDLFSLADIVAWFMFCYSVIVSGSDRGVDNDIFLVRSENALDTSYERKYIEKYEPVLYCRN